ncbi:MAG: DUF3553 domain-containing protein [Acidobacteriota bacterium]
MFERGQIVRNPKEVSWGNGKVLEMSGPDKVRVSFDDGKTRLIHLSVVKLDLVKDAVSRFSSGFERLAPLPNLDLVRVRSACELFIAVMADNRPNSDDAGMARRVLEEMETRGRLTSTTLRRLVQWCHTDGSVYRRGVDIAHEICRSIFGRVITKDEL